MKSVFWRQFKSLPSHMQERKLNLSWFDKIRWRRSGWRGILVCSFITFSSAFHSNSESDAETSQHFSYHRKKSCENKWRCVFFVLWNHYWICSGEDQTLTSPSFDPDCEFIPALIEVLHKSTRWSDWPRWRPLLRLLSAETVRPPETLTDKCLFSPSGCQPVQPEDGEVREDRKDRRGLLRRRLQVPKQRHGADRRHQEVCGVGGRPHHQEDRTAGDQDAQGQLSSLYLLLLLTEIPSC